MDQVLNGITEQIRTKLTNAGVFHLILSRKKSTESIKNKITLKGSTYSISGKKIQDLYGIRIVLYFSSDINIALNIVRSMFTEIEESKSVDELSTETFGVARNNHVYQLPNEYLINSKQDYNDLIDHTFEVQYRTIFTEGILEIEHDFRYKYKDSWTDKSDLTRVLNSIIASLETNEWAINHVIEELTYSAYKNRDWESLLRNKLRLRINGELTKELKEILLVNSQFMKEIFKSERVDLLKILDGHFERIPLTYDNIIHILNVKKYKIYEITELLPMAIGWELNNL